MNTNLNLFLIVIGIMWFLELLDSCSKDKTGNAVMCCIFLFWTITVFQEV